MIRTVVAGAAGRMGQRLVTMVHAHPETALVGAFERPEHPAVGRDAGEVAGVGPLGVPIRAALEETPPEAQVLIDFTTAEASLAYLPRAADRGLAVVCGSTGFAPEALKTIQSLTGRLRCVLSPNMSVGVNVMFKIAGEMARILGPEYDLEILEVHHRLKKDAPSGTALRLAQVLAEATRRDLAKVAVYERRGLIGERSADEIGIQTWRAGDITGEHTVLFGGVGERLELVHRAHNRDNFARGAVRAAVWIVRQPNGLYDMQDVLGLK